jgi:hypothetical protein
MTWNQASTCPDKHFQAFPSIPKHQQRNACAHPVHDLIKWLNWNKAWSESHLDQGHTAVIQPWSRDRQPDADKSPERIPNRFCVLPVDDHGTLTGLPERRVL